LTRVIALVRAVNVGGTGKLVMADLTKLLIGMTFTGVKTLLQSGNVVFGTNAQADAALEATLEAAVLKKLGLQTAFYVRSADEWDAIIANNPYPEAAKTDPSHLLVMTFKTAPDPANVIALQAAIPGRETVHAIGKQLYLFYPDNIGDSKLPAIIERKLGIKGTARNWNTVRKLAAAASLIDRG
jgi:uncharacterized protein (DUF1697 family)